MGKSDELDRKRAAIYAWRSFPVGEDVHDLEPPPSTAAPAPAETAAGAGETAAGAAGEEAAVRAAKPEGGIESFRDDSQRQAAILADGVERAWSLPEAEQVAAVAELVRRAHEMGVLMVGMTNHPRESVRLFRMALRFWEQLPRDARAAARRAIVWSDLSDPEAIEVLTDVVKTHDGSLHGALTLALSMNADAREALSRISGAGARFGRLLDEARSASARSTLVHLIGIAGQPSGALALRRALRRPLFTLCWQAFDCLAEHFPATIEPDDVLFVLEAVIDHAPPWILRDDLNRQAHRYFPGVLADQITRLRPAGASTLLARLADGDCESRAWGADSFEAGWAFNLLASTFPEEAVPRIDAHLRDVRPAKRRLGAAAAARLPDDLAWPRLLTAAADPVPDIASLAQAAWLKRRGTLCRVDELAGLELALLDGPPSDRMRARISLMRTGPLEARAAMAEVLLAEAPDPEALVLLLFAMGDADLWEKRPRPGLPDRREGFARAVVARFGERGVLGLIALVERYADASFYGFFDPIADLFDQEGLVPEACYPVLRALAERRLDQVRLDYAYSPLMILARVGAPAELAPRLAAIAWSTELPSHVTWAAGKALTAAGRGDPAVDALLLDELTAAFAASDTHRFSRALFPAVHRRLLPAIEMAERVIARFAPEIQDDLALTQALHVCASALGDIDRFPPSCAHAAAAAGGTYAFALACRRVWKQRGAPAEDLRALDAAIAGPSAAAAVEAALALMHIGEIKPEDPRLFALAERAPLPFRARLLSSLLLGRALARALWPLIEEVLVSPDPVVADELCHCAFRLEQAGLRAEMLAVEPRVVSPRLRDDFDEWLYLYGDVEPYWQDEIEEASEEGEDGEDNGEDDSEGGEGDDEEEGGEGDEEEGGEGEGEGDEEEEGESGE